MLDPQTLQPGTLIDRRFEILRFVAAGGMGAIYEAKQMPLERRIALKVIRQELARDGQLVSRFQREAKTISQLTHSHTITLFDYGVSESGLMYLAMEWLDGADLGALLAKYGPLEPLRAARIAAQVAASLHEAHGKSIIHRDLKPENIFLIEREGRKDFVKVLDFGIAKIATGDAQTQITRVGMVCGTPQFMSPEQARGEDLDGRSDVYALGTVLHATLAGRAPFESESMLQIVMKHQTQPLPELPPHVPEELKAIIRHATAKRREDRFDSAEQMGQALEALSGGFSGVSGTVQAVSGEHGLVTGPGLSLGLQSAPVIATGRPAPVAPTTPFLSAGPASHQPTQATMPKTGRGSLLVVLVVVALLLVGGGVAAFVLLRAPKSGDDESAAAKSKPEAPADVGAAELPAATPSLAANDTSQAAETTAAATPETAAPAPNPCPEGMSINEDTKGRCCWSGQSWSSQRSSCIGRPTSCPGSLLPLGEGCMPAATEVAESVLSCRGGDALACFLVAEHYRDLDSATSKDFIAEAARLAEPGCNRDELAACSVLAITKMWSSTDEAVIEAAVAELDKGCDGNVGFACLALMSYYQQTGDAERQEQAAEKFCAAQPDVCGSDGVAIDEDVKSSLSGMWKQGDNY